MKLPNTLDVALKAYLLVCQKHVPHTTHSLQPFRQILGIAGTAQKNMETLKIQPLWEDFRNEVSISPTAINIPSAYMWQPGELLNKQWVEKDFF